MLEYSGGELCRVVTAVVVLVEESDDDAEINAFSEHSVSTIEEWRAPSEDDVWT